MIFHMDALLDKILFELKTLNPKYYREMDDPRIDTYYISINQNNYIVLSGIYGECDCVSIYNNNNIKYDIMTQQGINDYLNKYDEEMDDMCNIIFELKLDTFNGNINDLILLLRNSLNI